MTDAALDLLADAGYPDGLDLDFSLALSPENAPQNERIGVLAQEHLAEVGITFDIERVSWDNFVSNFFLQHPFYIISWFARPEEDFLLFMHNHSEGPWNDETSFNDPEFDEALESAQRALSDDERAEHYENCQQILQERGGYLVPFFADVLAGSGSNVHGYVADPLQMKVPVETVHKTN